MAETMDWVKIPKERIAVLIGTEGSTLKRIQALASCTLKVDSDTGAVHVTPGNRPADLYAVRTMIRAIGRGFSPEKAFALLDQDMLLEVLNLADYIPKGQFETKKARVIGRKGTARAELERHTECEISVYGKTISMIGTPENIPVCRAAIEMLLNGASHNRVQKFVEQKTQETEFRL